MHLGSLPAADRRAVRSTYRSLRLGVVVLLTMLVTAVAVQVTRTGCVLDSLSAYYWTGAHDVVVAALCAVGALLVAYTGTHDVEDALLDVAGFLAVVVALTPTEPTTGCPGGYVTDVPTTLADARTGLVALSVAGVLATATRTVVALRSGGTPAAVVMRLVGAGVVLVTAAGALLAPALTVARAHDTAAVLLFAAVIGVVVLRGFDARTRSHRWAVAYAALGAAMLMTLVTVVVLRAGLATWHHAVLVTEAALVTLFAASWLLQTVELWGEGDDDQAAAAPSGTTAAGH